MDLHDLILMLWVLGVGACVTLVGYSLDDLHERTKHLKDDLDQELRELIERDS